MKKITTSQYWLCLKHLLPFHIYTYKLCNLISRVCQISKRYSRHDTRVWFHYASPFAFIYITCILHVSFATLQPSSVNPSPWLTWKIGTGLRAPSSLITVVFHLCSTFLLWPTALRCPFLHLGIAIRLEVDSITSEGVPSWKRRRLSTNLSSSWPITSSFILYCSRSSPNRVSTSISCHMPLRWRNMYVGVLNFSTYSCLKMNRCRPW